MTGRTSKQSVIERFGSEAHRWDEVYSGTGRPVSRLWDRWGRESVRIRLQRTFEAAPDLGGCSVLDLGCGAGRYLVEAAARGATRLVGVDLAPEMIEMARRQIVSAGVSADVELCCRDVGEIDLAEEFDLVIANGLFDYVHEPHRVFAKAVGWCRGTFVASFPHRWALRSLPRSLFWRSRGIRIRLFDRRDITTLATRAGLQEPRIERVGPLFVLVGRDGPRTG